MNCGGDMGHPALLLIGTVMSIMFRYIVQDTLETTMGYLPGFNICKDTASANQAACYGNQMVFRIGFAFTIFFAAMMALVTCAKSKAHDGAWICKILFIAVLFICTFWMPDNSMADFAKACLYGAGVFIAIMILVLIEWVHAINDSWVKKGETSDSWMWIMLGTSVGCYIVSIVFIVLSILWFAKSGCSLAAAEISITVIGCFLMSLLSVSGINPNGSLLISAVVTLYSSYYMWSGLSASPDANCNTAGFPDWLKIAIGLVFQSIVMGWSAYTTAQDAHGAASLKRRKDDDEEEEDPEDKEPKGSYQRMSNTGDCDDDEDGPCVKDLLIKNFTYLVASMYMTMIVSNWTYDQHAQIKAADFGKGNTILWVQLISQWVTMILYTWTIVAPVILTNREFA